MDLNRAFERAIKIEQKQKNDSGADFLGRLQREYLTALDNGVVLGPPPLKPPSPIGEKIKGYRLERDFTQEEVAARARISLNTLQKIESGRTENMQFRTLERLARAFDLQPQDRTDLYEFINDQIDAAPRRRRRRRI